MKEIELTRGMIAKVSDRWFEYLSRWKWRATFTGHKWYAQTTYGPLHHQKTVYMHRVIMGVTNPKIEVDHRDGDGLNNQDENLRTCSKTKNQQNRGKTRSNKSGYKGVMWKENAHKFRAQIVVNGKNIHLGYFVDPVEAARAYDSAALEYFGSFARTNF